MLVANPDGIPIMFFMNLVTSLSLPLTILFNKSLMESKFSSRWRVRYVSPVFKDGNKQDVTNYRPACIMCGASKIFERLVFDMVFDQVKSMMTLLTRK